MMWDARSEDLSFINTRQPGSILHILGGEDRPRDGPRREEPPRHPAARRRGRHPRPLVLEGRDHLPDPARDGRELEPRAARAGRPRDRRGDGARPGIHWTFSPVLCLTRDLRWGRTGETFGEDPYLIGELGAALIRGYQGKGLDDPTAVLATAKHYAGYSETQGGRDASEADISRRKLRSYFLPPFERAARAGAMTFMTGYQSMDGVPSTANRWLLTDVLKNEWGFKGVLVTDWDNVGRLVHEQKVAADLRRRRDHGAARRQRHHDDDPAVLRGRHRGRAQRPARRSRRSTRPVQRLLALKFRMGLFENPRRPDLAQAAVEVARPDHRAADPRRRAPEPGAAPERRPAAARPGEGEVDRRRRPERRRRPAAARRLVARLAAAPAGGRQAPAREDDHRARRHQGAGARRHHGPLRARLLDRRRRPLRHPGRGRRGAGVRRGRGRGGRPPEVHRRGAEHRHARAAGRTDRAARRAGEDRQADGRRAREQQAARAAARRPSAPRRSSRASTPAWRADARSPRRCSAS